MSNIVWLIIACVHLICGIMMICLLYFKTNNTKKSIIITTTLLWANLAFFIRALLHLQ
jgi:succinate dehydrogenase hydrophobic anchor subunit